MFFVFEKDHPESWLKIGTITEPESIVLGSYLSVIQKLHVELL